jgi:hypothetical protein
MNLLVDDDMMSDKVLYTGRERIRRGRNERFSVRRSFDVYHLDLHGLIVSTFSGYRYRILIKQPLRCSSKHGHTYT